MESTTVLDSWICGERILVEELWCLTNEGVKFRIGFIDRKPPGLKKEKDMYSCHHGKQSILPEKGMWSFSEAETEFSEWLVEVENESLEDNPDRELDLYLIELFQYLFLHERVRMTIRGFSSRNVLVTFRKMVLRDYEHVALIFKQD
jgi:hypothetical protein